MTSKYKKAAAAHAQVGRAAQRKNIPFLPSSPELAPETDFNLSPDSKPIEILTNFKSDSDCGYTGGVNCHDFDMDFDGYADEEWSDSDEESVVEFEGDELENNLQELREPSKYGLITGVKTSQQWKKAEKKRGFGYTGNLQRSQQHHAKAACEREIICAKAKDSNNP
ncbi:hypothetical protein F4604DRAFT_1971959 [Suillus subluteus]|nr:hypothetical protein F4604DRAFT_1971959 [Suillus subluteus]